MKLMWEYDLPTDESSEDYEYESPIFVKDGQVYFVCRNRELQVNQLHIIDIHSGLGRIVDFPSCYISVIPSQFFFIDLNDRILLYVGRFLLFDGNTVSLFPPLDRYRKIDSYLHHEKRLFIANGLFCCLNLDTLSIEWEIEIYNSKRYSHGQLLVFENTITCFGRDSLLFVDIESGTIMDSLRLPRIDKLYYPIRLDAEHLILGYTNWSNAGILKYNTHTKQIVWRHKRKFEGPQLDCKLYQHDELVYWVKDDIELICIHAETGEEMFSVRTKPWLYTDLDFIGECILFGTAGANGYLNCLDAKSGEEIWSVFLKNGCEFFDYYQSSVIVGDFDKSIKQIDWDNGNVLQQLSVDGEVVGRICVHQDCIYTVIWGNEKKAIRLIRVRVEE